MPFSSFFTRRMVFARNQRDVYTDRDQKTHKECLHEFLHLTSWNYFNALTIWSSCKSLQNHASVVHSCNSFKSANEPALSSPLYAIKAYDSKGKYSLSPNNVTITTSITGISKSSAHIMSTVDDSPVHFFLPPVRPAPALNLKRMTSPSSTTYVLPCWRYLPAAFTWN